MNSDGNIKNPRLLMETPDPKKKKKNTNKTSRGEEEKKNQICTVHVCVIPKWKSKNQGF